MDDIENHCFRLSRSQGVSDLRESGIHYDTMLIERSFKAKSAFCSNSKSN